tara:strand:- start:49 stop:1059 length:1011 start_codon:yes stop_codon:yes gene_type:complete
MADEEIKSDSTEEIVNDSAHTIFISHDSRDETIATAFADLIEGVSAGMLQAFQSSDKGTKRGIAFGVEWYPKIMKKLEGCVSVVCLLTHRSLDRPWILYEAGVAKGKLDKTVTGLVLGPSLTDANQGPFAQFQNCPNDVGQISELVCQLIEAVPGARPSRDLVEREVGAFLSKIDSDIGQADSEPAGTRNEQTNAKQEVSELFEETKRLIRELPSRISHSYQTRYITVLDNIYSSYVDACQEIISNEHRTKEDVAVLWNLCHAVASQMGSHSTSNLHDIFLAAREQGSKNLLTQIDEFEQTREGTLSFTEKHSKSNSGDLYSAAISATRKTYEMEE